MVWATVLVMGVAVIFEPIRMGIAVLMVNRPRPMLQLLAFLCGGFAMGVGVGVFVLFILRSTPIASGRFTLPQVQITVGLLALLIAAALATNISARMLVRRPMAVAVVGGEAGGIVEEPAPPSALEKLSASEPSNSATCSGHAGLLSKAAGRGVRSPSCWRPCSLWPSR